MSEPWWNDKDKVGGLAATIVMIGLVCCLVVLALGICGMVAVWMIS